MKIKYSPCKHDHDTLIEVVDENSITIDGELVEFDSESVSFPDVHKQSGGMIFNAVRDESGELLLYVQRFYTGDCTEWDTGDYHAY